VKSTECGRYVKHFFAEITDEILNEDNSKNNAQLSKQRINCCLKLVFLYLLTEYKIENVIKSLKGTSTADYDDNLNYLVKQCTNI
jgi:hypothetical protein